MKSKVDKILPYLLMPASWIYGAVTWTRNKLFDLGILSQEEFDVPVIGVGNITVGGTGKTPHTEYLVNKLCTSYRVAVLSRGYKRKTRGFILANSKSTPETIGDEPWQIYNKFGMKAKVAVCENRKKGITQLLRLFPDLELVILDDSFQHRWVKPKISIMLMEYSRPVYADKLLPLGRLRESAHEINRADKVIVTKCPENLTAIDFRIVVKQLDLMKFQKLYFSTYRYGALQPVFPDDAPFSATLSSLTEKDSIMLLTGIAHPRNFVLHFKPYPFNRKVEHFPDHHDFSRKDLVRIENRFRAMRGERKIIVTTEKDAVRLLHNPYFPAELKPFIFYLPIEVNMLGGVYGNDNNLIEDILQELHLAPIEDGNNEQDNAGNAASSYDGDYSASGYGGEDSPTGYNAVDSSAGYNSEEAFGNDYGEHTEDSTRYNSGNYNAEDDYDARFGDSSPSAPIISYRGDEPTPEM